MRVGSASNIASAGNLSLWHELGLRSLKFDTRLTEVGIHASRWLVISIIDIIIDIIIAFNGLCYLAGGDGFGI